MGRRPEATEQLHPTRIAGASGEGNGMVGYFCRMCHFKFARKKEAEVTTCPYCGRDSVSHAYEGKAQDLIEQAGEEQDELLFR